MRWNTQVGQNILFIQQEVCYLPTLLLVCVCASGLPGGPQSLSPAGAPFPPPEPQSLSPGAPPSLTHVPILPNPTGAFSSQDRSLLTLWVLSPQGSLAGPS